MIEASTQRLKLIDFGLSKHLESVATLGVGTPDYMPPGQSSTVTHCYCYISGFGFPA